MLLYSQIRRYQWFFTQHERCVQIYRLTGNWNDKECDAEISYMCKKEKEKLPPPEEDEVIDEGCEPGWRAYGKRDIFICLTVKCFCS